MPNTESPSKSVVRISAPAYLRTLAVLLWECLAHPFSTSTIDARTGRLLHRTKG